VTRLISFDIDGTLEVGDPPGVISIATVRRAHERGIVVGSCSDRPVRSQQALWEQHGLPVRFTVLKQNLSVVRAEFEVEHYLHIGDSIVDRVMAQQAGFDFLHAEDDDVEAFLASLLEE
jgi:hydroxymethylpyrimidine pyrophosphatase-like HAD family hydrolase